MTLEKAIDKYVAAIKNIDAARKELYVAEKILLENSPYKVGDKVLVSDQTVNMSTFETKVNIVSGFVTEVNISAYHEQINPEDLLYFVVRLPTKSGAFSDRTKVIDYHARSKDLQLDN